MRIDWMNTSDQSKSRIEKMEKINLFDTAENGG